MYEVRRGYDFRTKRRMMDEAGNVERPACYEPQATHFPFVSNIDTSGTVLSPRQWYSAAKKDDGWGRKHRQRACYEPQANTPSICFKHWYNGVARRLDGGLIKNRLELVSPLEQRLFLCTNDKCVAHWLGTGTIPLFIDTIWRNLQNFGRDLDSWALM